MSETTEKKPVSIYDVLVAMIDQTAAIAWQKMGLQNDFMTGQVETNMAEARVAIDVTAKLAEVVEPQLDDADRREMQNLVRTLRINYVERNK